MIAPLAGWIAAHDASFVATPNGVKIGLAAAKKGVARLKAAAANAPAAPNAPAAAQMAAATQFYDWFLERADKEISQFAVGLNVDQEGGLHIDIRALFFPGGAWATAGKNLEHSGAVKLATLPAGPFMMAFDGKMPSSLSKNYMNLSVDMLNSMNKAGGGKALTPEQIKQLNEMSEKSMHQMESMAMVMRVPPPGASLYESMVAAIKVKDSAKYIADYQKAFAGLKAAFGKSGAAIPIFSDAKKVKIGDLNGVRMTMDMGKVLAQQPNNPATKQMMKMMFGPDEKLNVYMAPVNKTTVAMCYVKPENILHVKAACENPQASLAADSDIAETAKLLPKGAQWVCYISPKGFMELISSVMLNVLPPGQAPPALPAFPQTPPIGIGAELSSRGLDLQIVAPAAAIKGIGTYVKEMQRMFAPGAPPQIR